MFFGDQGDVGNPSPKISTISQPWDCSRVIFLKFLMKMSSALGSPYDEDVWGLGFRI